MSLIDAHQFLLAAHTAAPVHDYFHWRVVGASLKWPEMRSLKALRTLSDMVLVAARLDEARILAPGRALALQLLAQNNAAQADSVVPQL